jgi:hypothetical protein
VASFDGRNYEVAGTSASVKATHVNIAAGKVVNVKFEGSGEIELTLPKAMISGISAVQVADGGDAIEYTATETELETTIRFTVSQDAVSVDITGLHVVPEFAPSLAAIIGAISITGVIILTSKHRRFRK